MGMYDTINGEQIKLFDRNYVKIDKDGNVFSSGVGGRLKYYDKGKRVPYKTFYYNLGKNFDILNLEPYEHDKPMIHQIRSGINTGYKTLDEISDGEFSEVCYGTHGMVYKNINHAAIEEIIECHKLIHDTTLDSSIKLGELWDYRAEHKDDVDFKSKIEEMFTEIKKLEKEEDEKFWKPIFERLNKYRICDYTDLIENKDYQLLGSIIANYGEYNKDSIKDHLFMFLHDERLNFIAASTAMEDILNNIDLKDYFKYFDVTKKQQEVFIASIQNIRESVEVAKQIVYKKEDLGESLLKDIHDGAYKKAYLRYNVLPYDGFDITTWDKDEK